MPELVIIRGVPGSGKTTIATTRYPNHFHFEADMFHMKKGEYNYNPERIQQAHSWCQNMVRQSLREGRDVVVSNTFTRMWEMQPYLDMGFPVKVIEATGDYENIHGVPADVVQMMRDRFEVYEGGDPNA